MKILFLTHYFPPEVNAPATRTFEHCRYWVEQGHEVTVVTAAPNHPRGKVYDGYKNHLYQKEVVKGIQVIRLWTFVTPNEGFIKRTLNYVSYMLAVMLAIPFLPRVDVVISTSPQFFCGLAGYPVKLFKRVPWVLEIRDLWPESILTVGAIKNKAIIRILEFLESFAYRKANHIVPVTDAFKAHMVKKGVSAEKITVIKNGVDLSFYEPDKVNVRDSLANEYSDSFIASYFGTHGMAHHLETILEAAEILKARADIKFLLIGDGAEKARIRKLKEEKGLTNVIMLDQQPKSMMPEYWAISDVSLILLKKSDLFKTVIPSKIFESMAMKRPIILGVEGEVKQMLDESGAGIAIEPENAEQLANAVVSLADNKAELNSCGEKGRAYVSSYFDRTVLAGRYIQILSDLKQ
ncbi:MAG: glycosyltransferase family 4 protein [Gammaproteobacteria bacterium]|nr:glycosyltransferase family 4 protein [Gammaproteobacteria bacterium]